MFLACPLFLSDKERTLVDLIYFPAPVGGLKRAFDILEEQVIREQVDTKKFIEYASRFPIVSTGKRIGFTLDKIGCSRQELLPLLKKINKTSLITLFDTKSRKGSINKEWRIIANVPA